MLNIAQVRQLSHLCNYICLCSRPTWLPWSQTFANLTSTCPLYERCGNDIASTGIKNRICAVVQVHSSAKGLRLVTFDADGTLYADGCHMEHDNEMVRHNFSSHCYLSFLWWPFAAADIPGLHDILRSKHRSPLLFCAMHSTSTFIADAMQQPGRCNVIVSF